MAIVRYYYVVTNNAADARYFIWRQVFESCLPIFTTNFDLAWWRSIPALYAAARRHSDHFSSTWNHISLSAAWKAFFDLFLVNDLGTQRIGFRATSQWSRWADIEASKILVVSKFHLGREHPSWWKQEKLVQVNRTKLDEFGARIDRIFLKGSGTSIPQL